MTNQAWIEELRRKHELPEAAWMQILGTYTPEDQAFAADMAREIAQREFGKNIYFRGIVEFTNFCKNNCRYCGIRRDNRDIRRYRLSMETILSCCENGWRAGFRTFVLQGGEDPWFTDDRMADIVSAIHEKYPECAITLSIGERPEESYRRLFEAGASRFLLRHETADEAHYALLHPTEQSFQKRMECLKTLKKIGYQTGCGMMVGSPGQTVRELAEDMLFMAQFQPEMIGTGPFLPHHATPFRNEPAGSVDLTLLLLSLCRIMLPRVLLPATTALGTACEDGRKRGVLAGANVIMPNLSPCEVRKDYMLYDNKAVTGEDAAEALQILQLHMEEIGYTLLVGRGDFHGRTSK